MAPNTVTCPECASAVPQGRLSCPECGSLLASVAGLERRANASRVAEGPADVAPEPPALIPEEPPEPAVAPGQPPPSPPPPPIVGEWTGPLPQIALTQPIPTAPGSATEAPFAVGSATLGQQATPEPEAGSETESPAGPPAEPAAESPSEPEPEPQPAIAEPLLRPEVAEPLLQPSTSSPGLGTQAPKRAFGQSILRAPAESSPQPPGRAAAAPAPTPLAGRLAEGLPRDLAGWTTAAGAGLAAVSFILPWATFVLGASGLGDGYFEVWGLANPANILLMLLALFVLGLVVLPNRVADWIRLLAVPLVLGGALLGLAWPYLVGPYGPRLGLWLNVFGGILLIAGGLLALRAARHTAAEPHV